MSLCAIKVCAERESADPNLCWVLAPGPFVPHPVHYHSSAHSRTVWLPDDQHSAQLSSRCSSKLNSGTIVPLWKWDCCVKEAVLAAAL